MFCGAPSRQLTSSLFHTSPVLGCLLHLLVPVPLHMMYTLPSACSRSPPVHVYPCPLPPAYTYYIHSQREAVNCPIKSKISPPKQITMDVRLLLAQLSMCSPYKLTFLHLRQFYVVMYGQSTGTSFSKLSLSGNGCLELWIFI